MGAHFFSLPNLKPEWPAIQAPMSGPVAARDALLPIVAYRRNPYEKHHLHPELYEPLFEHFKYPELAEPLRAVARLNSIIVDVRTIIEISFTNRMVFDRRIIISMCIPISVIFNQRTIIEIRFTHSVILDWRMIIQMCSANSVISESRMMIRVA
jgi:hypothetical protein